MISKSVLVPDHPPYSDITSCNYFFPKNKTERETFYCNTISKIVRYRLFQKKFIRNVFLEIVRSKDCITSDKMDFE